MAWQFNFGFALSVALIQCECLTLRHRQV